MLIGNSLAFPASLSNPGRRRPSQGHTVRSQEEPRGWTKGPRQLTCAADSLSIGDRSPSRLTENGVLLQSLSCSPGCALSPSALPSQPQVTNASTMPCRILFGEISHEPTTSMDHAPVCWVPVATPWEARSGQGWPTAACVGHSQVSLWVLLWLRAGTTPPHTHICKRLQLC